MVFQSLAECAAAYLGKHGTFNHAGGVFLL
jgi:hypothetical protein